MASLSVPAWRHGWPASRRWRHSCRGSPYTSITAIAARLYFVLPVRWLVRGPFDSLSRIGRVRAPILMLQGDRDTVIPPGLGPELFEAAPEPKRIWSAPGRW